MAATKRVTLSRGLGFAAMLVLGACSGAGRSAELRILAASSLTEAVGQAAVNFERRQSLGVAVSFAATSVLARQVEAGIGADVFLSADRGWMDRLEKEKLLAPGTRRDLCGNRLVLIAAAGAPELRNWGDLRGPGVRRVALADPTHVPAGIYAKRALERLGLWRALEARVAPAVDARAALAYVERGEAEFGIVYATDAALSPRVRVARTFPGEPRDPIRYQGAVLAGSSRPEEARAFLDSLNAELWQRHGFLALGR